MERVIVTVQLYNDSQVRDIEIPVDMPVESLLREIPLAFGWSDHYEIYAEPPGRVLSRGETLLQAGVWDGARLTFQPTGIPTRQGGPPPPSVPPPTQGPVKGWRPLDTSGPSAPSSPQPPQPTPSGGFLWKQVDED